MTNEDGSSDAVRVAVRVRPMSASESNYESIVATTPSSVTLTSPRDNSERSFAYDIVFGTDSTQLEVYNRAARPIIESVLQGYNATIFAYGQTGTGKTWTMEGDNSKGELWGITPNAFAHVFGHIGDKESSDECFLVRASYLELYNEELRDLLAKDQMKRLELKERPDVGVYVKELTSFVVHNADDLNKLMEAGKRNRSVAATDMNAHSSRSHAIFSVTVECSARSGAGGQHVRVGKLHLVDLAGSERQSKTGATGMRLKEATKINLSLSTLGNVISALVDGKSSHIPYRNSKLTRLLQDALGGNAKTLMIANVGPAAYNFDESLSTLRYAHRAKSIQNHARINEDPKDALMKQYQKEIEELRRQLQDGDDPDEDDEEEDDDDDDDDDHDDDRDDDETRVRRVRRSSSQVASLQAEVESERARLRAAKDLAQEERDKLESQLSQKLTSLESAQKEEKMLRAKLASLESRILVGGENLLDTSAEQTRLLAKAAQEMQETVEREARLKAAEEAKQAEMGDKEEKYESLQEEAAAKTRKLKKLLQLYQTTKAEIEDERAAQQREMEGLLDNVRQLSRELNFQLMLIDAFVPNEYRKLIEQHAHWRDDLAEWQLRGIAYTGNNMRRREQEAEVQTQNHSVDDKEYLASVYLDSDEEKGGEGKRVADRRRPKSSKGRNRK